MLKKQKLLQKAFDTGIKNNESKMLKNFIQFFVCAKCQ